MRGVAVLGHTGRLGSQLAAVLNERHIPWIGLARPHLRLPDISGLRNVLEHAAPVDTVINCVAYHDTKAIEAKEAKLAFSINAKAVRDLSVFCSAHSLKFVQISTDYVFGGMAPSTQEGYTEQDPVAPVNIYGASKVAGENLVLASNYNSLIVRVASLFGSPSDRGDFVRTVVQKFNAGETMDVVDDVTMSPTYTRDAALQLIDVLINLDPRGVMHLVNSGESATWYEFARCVADLIHAPTEFLTPAVLAQSGDPVPRPPSSALVPSSFVGLPDWRFSVESHLASLDIID